MKTPAGVMQELPPNPTHLAQKSGGHTRGQFSRQLKQGTLPYLSKLNLNAREARDGNKQDKVKIHDPVDIPGIIFKVIARDRCRMAARRVCLSIISATWHVSEVGKLDASGPKRL